jgi:hypothetical protein
MKKQIYDDIIERNRFEDLSLGYDTQKCKVLGKLRKYHLMLQPFYIKFLNIESSRSNFDDNNIVKKFSISIRLREYREYCRNQKIMINENNDLKIFFDNVKNIIERRGFKGNGRELYDMIESGEFKLNCIPPILKYLEVSIPEHITIFLILIFQKLKLYNQLDNSIFVDLYEYMN